MLGLEVVAGAEAVVLDVEDGLEGFWEEGWRFEGILCAWKWRRDWTGFGEGRIRKGPQGDWTWKDVQRETKFEECALKICWRENVAASEIAPSFSVSIAGTAEDEPPCRSGRVVIPELAALYYHSSVHQFIIQSTFQQSIPKHKKPLNSQYHYGKSTLISLLWPFSQFVLFNSGLTDSPFLG